MVDEAGSEKNDVAGAAPTKVKDKVDELHESSSDKLKKLEETVTDEVLADTKQKPSFWENFTGTIGKLLASLKEWWSDFKFSEWWDNLWKSDEEKAADSAKKAEEEVKKAAAEGGKKDEPKEELSKEEAAKLEKDKAAVNKQRDQELSMLPKKITPNTKPPASFVAWSEKLQRPIRYQLSWQGKNLRYTLMDENEHGKKTSWVMLLPQLAFSRIGVNAVDISGLKPTDDGFGGAIKLETDSALAGTVPIEGVKLAGFLERMGTESGGKFITKKDGKEVIFEREGANSLPGKKAYGSGKSAEVTGKDSETNSGLESGFTEKAAKWLAEKFDFSSGKAPEVSQDASEEEKEAVSWLDRAYDVAQKAYEGAKQDMEQKVAAEARDIAVKAIVKELDNLPGSEWVSSETKEQMANYFVDWMNKADEK